MLESPVTYPDYPTPLQDIDFGVPFYMLNYGSEKWIRVKCATGLLKVRSEHSQLTPFNDDGHHVPIVSLTDGTIAWMSKIKPCNTEVPKSIKNRISDLEGQRNVLSAKIRKIARLADQIQEEIVSSYQTKK